MKAMTMSQGGGGNRYLHHASKVTVRRATKYFTAVAAETLLDKFNWSQDRTISFLEHYYEQYKSMNIGNVAIQEYEGGLHDTYGYTVALRNKCQKPKATPVAALEQRMTDLCLLWIVQVMVITLMDKYGWSATTVTRFVRNIDAAIPKFADGGGDYEERLKRLREKHGLDIRAHIKMGGDAL